MATKCRWCNQDLKKLGNSPRKGNTIWWCEKCDGGRK